MSLEQTRGEILAPVGGMQQLLAAVRCGADAVYLGAKGFNARRNAENFAQTGLREAVGYCHARGVKVYVTVNTLVLDSEREALEETALEVAQSGADAVIIQDMAVLRLFRDRCADMRLHASTQTAVHNADGAKFLRDAGFDRFVLARELSLREIEKIVSQAGIEAESFVHGALCMCVSGGCYLSSMIGGRSGNRGLCAQPCRLDFRCSGQEHALSLKDMSYIGHIRELSEAGVASFKIEGRMKRPEYVAAAVTACRDAMQGRPYDLQGLQAVFSRSGFTDGYLTGRRDRQMFGFRTREDVTAAEGALSRYAALYRRETSRVPLSASFSMDARGAALTLEAAGKRCTVRTGATAEAESRPTNEQSVRRSVEKLGGTPFYLDELHTQIEGNRVLGASALNAMRREAAQQLLEELEQPVPHPLAPEKRTDLPPHQAAKREYWLRFEKEEQMSGMDMSCAKRVILPVRVLEKAPHLIERFSQKLIVELPSLCFPDDEEALEARMRALRDLGVREVMANNIYAVSLAKRLGLIVHGGWGLNIANADALDFYAQSGVCDAVLSFELSMKAIAHMKGTLPRGLIGYGRLPLMRVRNCPARTQKGCGSCDGRPVMTDRTGRRFTLVCQEKRYTALLNDVPVYTADKFRAPVDFEVLYFTMEDARQARRVLEAYLACAPPPVPRTGGLYYRTLQ